MRVAGGLQEELHRMAYSAWELLINSKFLCNCVGSGFHYLCILYFCCHEGAMAFGNFINSATKHIYCVQL